MESSSNIMGSKLIIKSKYITGIICCFLFFSAGLVFAQTPPENLDFIGGYYENGEYRCYSEPCFSLHRGKGAASARIRPFEIREWLPRRGDKWSCQQAYTEMLSKTSQVEVSLFKKKSCKLISNGKWKDTYTGKMIDGMKTIAVDQRISLKEAHHYGGAFWTRPQRMAFAYSPMNLIPVSTTQKRDRNGRSASAWMPDDKSTWCDYIVHREIVARQFKLIIPSSEKMYEKKIKKLYCKY